MAQTAKVLICAPGNLNAAKATDATLQKFYHEKIDLSDTLTEAINNYQAVFLLLNYSQKLTIEQENLLRTYLTKSKSLYLENFLDEVVMRASDSYSFWRFLGIADCTFDALERESME